jgi:aryl-alcohol dehydrogenase-like predicted oxidoreductase
VSFLYWASGDKSPAFAQAFKELAASPSRPELFIAANCRTSPEFVREDVTATLRELELDVLDAVVVQYILPEEDGDKVQAALEAAQQLKAEGLVRHVAASTHSFDLADITTSALPTASTPVQLSSSGMLDAIMLRYNMAHRTVE